MMKRLEEIRTGKNLEYKMRKRNPRRQIVALESNLETRLWYYCPGNSVFMLLSDKDIEMWTKF